MNAIRGPTGYIDKQGLIVNQRYNGRGITSDYLIEWMPQEPLYYYMFRAGEDIATPGNRPPPVKVRAHKRIERLRGRNGGVHVQAREGRAARR
jgi:hypothetical protein